MAFGSKLGRNFMIFGKSAKFLLENPDNEKAMEGREEMLDSIS